MLVSKCKRRFRIFGRHSAKIQANPSNSSGHWVSGARRWKASRVLGQLLRTQQVRLYKARVYGHIYKMRSHLKHYLPRASIANHSRIYIITPQRLYARPASTYRCNRDIHQRIYSELHPHHSLRTSYSLSSVTNNLHRFGTLLEFLTSGTQHSERLRWQPLLLNSRHPYPILELRLLLRISFNSLKHYLVSRLYIHRSRCPPQRTRLFRRQCLVYLPSRRSCGRMLSPTHTFRDTVTNVIEMRVSIPIFTINIRRGGVEFSWKRTDQSMD